MKATLQRDGMLKTSFPPWAYKGEEMRAMVVLTVALGALCAEAFAPPPGAVSLAKFSLSLRRVRAQGAGLRMQEEGTQSRRGMLLKAAAAGAAGLAVQLCPQAVAASESELTPEPKFKFRRVPRIQFIAALGDPAASSGTGAGIYRKHSENKLSLI
jgi:hypothetical protein